MSNNKQKQIKTLLIEDDERDAFLIKEKLAYAKEAKFDLTHVDRLATAVKLLQRELSDVILLDLSLPDSNGLETFLSLQTIVPNLPIVLLTAVNDESLALKAVREGAQDYLIKGQTTTEVLIRSVNYAIERVRHLEKIHQSEIRLQQVNQELTQQIKNRTSELEYRNQELKKLFLRATTDKVTGIANRYRLEDFMQREWGNAIRHQISVSVIMIDIDRFKLYNDTYGHQAGDRCLRQVAQTINNSVRRSKDLVARYGGEEFIVVLSDISLDGAITVAENISFQVKALSIPHATAEISDYVTISLGVAHTIPSINSQADRLILAADKALYLAKQKGRDRVEIYQIPLKS
ncbi:MAG: diguanylate cyclase [Waterburya sp.]